MQDRGSCGTHDLAPAITQSSAHAFSNDALFRWTDSLDDH